MGKQNSYTTISWGAFDNASHAPQLRSCSYCVCVCVCVCVGAYVSACVCVMLVLMTAIS